MLHGGNYLVGIEVKKLFSSVKVKLIFSYPLRNARFNKMPEFIFSSPLVPMEKKMKARKEVFSASIRWLNTSWFNLFL